MQMGMLVLYVLFVPVGLWLVSEALWQQGAPFRYRVLALLGFGGVVAGVALGNGIIAGGGGVCFLAGQFLVTRHVRKGRPIGWTVGFGRKPAPRRGRRRPETQAAPAAAATGAAAGATEAETFVDGMAPVDAFAKHPADGGPDTGAHALGQVGFDKGFDAQFEGAFEGVYLPNYGQDDYANSPAAYGTDYAPAYGDPTTAGAFPGYADQAPEFAPGYAAAPAYGTDPAAPDYNPGYDTNAYATGQLPGYPAHDTGGYAVPATGGYAVPDTGGYAAQDTGGYAVQDTGGYTTPEGTYIVPATGGYPAQAPGFPVDPATGGYPVPGTGGYAVPDPAAPAYPPAYPPPPGLPPVPDYPPTAPPA
ncbi:hypothetical protein ACPA54_19415 [Uniformispora flossi]|uniref:hypothetical protein n=1 Tax=Uniformispora flossi TaxID=3390723 RepID=UPI003C2C9D09